MLTVEPAHGRSPSQLAADSAHYQCAKNLQTPTQALGGVDGVLCSFPDVKTYVYYTAIGNDAWTVAVNTGVPPKERTDFLQSFVIPS